MLLALRLYTFGSYESLIVVINWRSVETVNLLANDGRVKVAGTLVCVSGAVLMVFYKGPALYGVDSSNTVSQNELSINANSHMVGWLASQMLGFGIEKWHLGVLCLIGNCFLMAAYLVLQVYSIRISDALLNLTMVDPIILDMEFSENMLDLYLKSRPRKEIWILFRRMVI